MPGLAEAAAPGAAPEDLDVEAVVHDLGERHELLLRVRPVGQVGDGALLDDAPGTSASIGAVTVEPAVGRRR